jgi:site-specific DNA-methyltransferase (adenine-specific)
MAHKVDDLQRFCEEATKTRAPRNRTLTCTEAEMVALSTELLRLSSPTNPESLTDRIVNQDFDEVRPFLPNGFVDLLILDPPYNLTKDYNGHVFRLKEADKYYNTPGFLDQWIR